MQICYVLCNPAFPGWVKVGFTSKPTMESRLRTYQTSDPNRGYTVLYKRETDDAKLVEKEVHSRLTAVGCIRKNEWFKANPTIVANMVDGVIEEIDSGLLNQSGDYTG